MFIIIDLYSLKKINIRYKTEVGQDNLDKELYYTTLPLFISTSEQLYYKDSNCRMKCNDGNERHGRFSRYQNIDGRI